MKKFLIPLFLLLCGILQVNAQLSLTQRIAFAAFTQDIAAKGISQTIASFCFDAGRHAPINLNTYKQMHYGEILLAFGNDAPISIMQARNNGSITVEGTGVSGFRIRNNTNKSIHVESKKGGLFGDEAGDTEGISEFVIDYLSSHKPSQDEYWLLRRKITIFRKEGLLLNNNPTEVQFKQAEAAFKKNHKIKNDYDLEDLIYERAHLLEKAEKGKAEKLVVYRYHGFITDGMPTAQELQAADVKYRKLNGLSPTQEISYSIIEDKEYILDQMDFFEYEGLLSPEQKNPTDCNQAFKIYSQQIGKSPEDTKTILLARISEYRSSKSKAATMLSMPGFRNLETGKIEEQLGLTPTGSPKSKALIEALSFYYDNIRPFIKDENSLPSTDISTNIKRTKASLGLPATLEIVPVTKEYFKNFQTKIKSQNINLSNVSDCKVHNDNIYILTRDHKVFKTSINAADNKISLIYELSSDYISSLVDKVSSDLYLYDGKLVPISEIHDAIQKSYDQTICFGANFSVEDIQSFVSTHKIKDLLSDGENALSFTKVSANQYVIPIDPVIEITKRYYSTDISFTLNKKSNPVKGSGIIGNINFRLINIANTAVNRVVEAIKSVFRTSSANAEIDFARELKSELKKLNIDPKQLFTDVSSIEIVEIKVNIPDAFKFNEYDRTNPPISMYTWELLSLNQRGISYGLVNGRKKRFRKIEI